MYPSAPSDIRIEVQARRLPASDQNMNYGIVCRLHGDNAYVLTISDDYASIERYGAYKLLKEAKILVNANSENRLQAIVQVSREGRQSAFSSGLMARRPPRQSMWIIHFQPAPSALSWESTKQSA